MDDDGGYDECYDDGDDDGDDGDDGDVCSSSIDICRQVIPGLP